MMYVKQGVSFTSMAPQILLGITIASKIYESFEADLTITSCCDGKHSENSLHYIGHAVDLRTRNISSDEQQRLLAELESALGDEFDVVLESDHLHVEYQP